MKLTKPRRFIVKSGGEMCRIFLCLLGGLLALCQISIAEPLPALTCVVLDAGGYLVTYGGLPAPGLTAEINLEMLSTKGGTVKFLSGSNKGGEEEGSRFSIIEPIRVSKQQSSFSLRLPRLSLIGGPGPGLNRLEVYPKTSNEAFVVYTAEQGTTQLGIVAMNCHLPKSK